MTETKANTAVMTCPHTGDGKEKAYIVEFATGEVVDVDHVADVQLLGEHVILVREKLPEAIFHTTDVVSVTCEACQAPPEK